MADQHHLDILNRGVEAWNKWRQDNPEVIPDLSGADLSGTDLGGANLSHAILTEANVRGALLIAANLSRAILAEADVRGATLNFADLSFADLSGASLSSTDLNGADFTGASLSEANLSGANLRGANLIYAVLDGADLSGADLHRANLESTSLVKTNLTKAVLTGCRVFGVSAWKLELEGAEQKSLIITEEDEPSITVDNLEVAQFIYLLVNNEKIRQVIDTVTSEVVLILGRFTEERMAVLDAIREELRKRDYLPVLFDFDKPANRDVHETVTTLARLARFIIADITDPRSIPQELVSIVPTLPSVPVQPLLQRGSEPWGMYEYIARYPWVLEIHYYDSLDNLLTSLDEDVIAPAEAKADELKPRAP